LCAGGFPRNGGQNGDCGGRERKEMNKKQINICIAAIVMFAICAISNIRGLHFSSFSNGVVGSLSFDLRTTLFEWAAMAIVFGAFFFFFKTPNKNG
jgi:hypothetical protein